VRYRSTRSVVRALEQAVDELGESVVQLRADRAPFSEVARLNLAFDQLGDLAEAVAGRAPFSEVERLNGAFDRLGDLAEALAERAPMSEVERLNVAFSELADVRTVIARKANVEVWNPPYSAEAFQGAFRGTREEIADRYRALAGEFVGFDPVVDLGCGRGEFLELMLELGVSASGVDADAELMEMLRQAGLDVEAGDAGGFLRRLENHSLGGVSMIQVIEHLSIQQAAEVASLTADKLRPGGKLVIETVNPRSLNVYTNAFYVDPTHLRPVHPSYLMFLLREVGFSAAEIRWRSPTPEEERLETVDEGSPDLNEQLNRNFARLNDLLFGYQDYAVIALR